MSRIWVSVAAATGYELCALPDHSQFHTVHGHQCGWHVYQIFNRSWTAFGLHRDTQGDGAQEGVGEGAAAHPKAARFK